ncbi:MAG: cytosolic protein, partial [Vallitaleaceae bacterium]|nr:cytosolic protein [Vallitaleaceae bacterium]
MEMHLIENLKFYLENEKKSRIPLDALVKVVPGDTKEADFAQAILKLEKEGILIRVKSAGENHKAISLANMYTLKKQELKSENHRQLLKKQLEMDARISLESYFHLAMSVFEKDLIYIEKVNKYFKSNNLPKEQLTLPKLSVILVHDEKWLGEKGG